MTFVWLLIGAAGVCLGVLALVFRVKAREIRVKALRQQNKKIAKMLKMDLLHRKTNKLGRHFLKKKLSSNRRKYG